MSNRPKNVGASVRQRLLNIARDSGSDFAVTLSNYALERLLYRLSCSSHSDRFVLKGAMLFRKWSDQPHRATRDMDLLAFGSPAAEDVTRLIRDICSTSVDDDGVEFLPHTLRTEEIREAQEYDGIRVKLTAIIAGAHVPLQIDIGFGDAVVPEPQELVYPTLLEFPAPTIRAYSRESVIAEKLHAMVSLGIANSRMKDFFDIYTLATTSEFMGEAICAAIRATFERRSTAIPSDTPVALTPEFSTDRIKVSQWQAFTMGGSVKGVGVDLAAVVELLCLFLLQPLTSLSRGESLAGNWLPAGHWTVSDRE